MVNPSGEGNSEEDMHDSEGSNQHNETPGVSENNEGEILSTIENENGSDSHSVGIFERLMDTVLGMNRNNDRTNRSSSTDTVDNPRGSITTESLNMPGHSGTTQTTTQDTANGGAIVITVNYVFSDENNPQNPNRSGSLVMTLPNSSSNRDPRVIQEFIRLATQMAYSTIIQGLNKEKGITIDKFNSFPVKDSKSCEDSDSCSICFEKYDVFNVKKREISLDSDNEDEEGKAFKKRKAEVNTSVNSEANNTRNSTTGENTSRRIPPKREPKYLSEFRGTFSHIPIEMLCGHSFGKSCLFEWLKNHTTCPLCRCSVADPSERSRTNTANTSTPRIIGLNNLQYNMQANQPTLLTGANRISDILDNLGPGTPENSSLRRVLRSGSGVPAVNEIASSNSQDESPSNNDTTQSTIISHLLTYLTRPQSNNSQPLFPTGVMSRRTENGVESRQSDNTENDDDVVNFMNLRSLVGDETSNLASRNTQSSEPDQNSVNQQSESNDNNEVDNSDT